MANIKEAVEAMHLASTSMDNDLRKKGEQWLVKFQKRMEAWQVCDQILNQSGLPGHVYFCAAQTLKKKLETSYRELPESARASFRDTLFNHFAKFAAVENKVADAARRQLCTATALLALQMAEWNNGIQHVVQAMANNNAMIVSLLQFLVVLVQELYDGRVELPRPRYEALEASVDQNAEQILRLLAHYCQMIQSPQYAGKKVAIGKEVLQCFGAWVRYANISPQVIANSPVLGFAFDAVREESMFEVAVDTVLDVIDCTKHIQNWQAVIGKVITKSLLFVPIFEQHSRDTVDFEVCRRLGHIFVTMGERYLPLVLNGSPQSKDIVFAIMRVAAHPNPEVSKLSFNFWYALSQDITNIQDNPTRDARIQAFKGLFLQLVDTIRGIMTYPKDFETWDAETQSDYKRYRYMAVDPLIDSVHVLGASTVLHRLSSALEGQLDALKQNPKNWQGVESSLHCVRSIARAVIDQQLGDNDAENKILDKIMSVLPKMTHNQYIRYTANLIIGRYADWLNTHPKHIPEALKFLVDGLGDKHSVSSASLAFKNVCDGCAGHLANQFFDPLFEVYNNSGNLHIQDQKEVIEGMCFVCQSLPPERFQDGLTKLVAFVAKDIHYMMDETQKIIQQQQQLVQSANESAKTEVNAYIAKQNTEVMERICLTLDRLAHIFQKIKPRYMENYIDSHIPITIVKMLEHLWPLLDKALKMFKVDDRVMERLCRCWKYAIKAAEIKFAPFLIPLVKELIELFTATPHSSFLYVASICVYTFGPHVEFHATLTQILTVFTQQTFALLKDKAAFVANPDIVEDYFDLVSRFVKHCPSLIYSHPALPVVFQKGLIGLTIDHREAHSAASAFFGDTILHACPVQPDEPDFKRRSQPAPAVVNAVRNLLQQHGQSLVDTIIQSIASAPPHHCIQAYVHVIHNLLVFAREEIRQMLLSALAKVPETENPSREQFIQQLVSTDIKKFRKAAIKSLAAAYRAQSRR